MIFLTTYHNLIFIWIQEHNQYFNWIFFYYLHKNLCSTEREYFATTSEQAQWLTSPGQIM